jgi:hypothetical protein
MIINNNVLVKNENVIIKINEMEAGWIYNKCSEALDLIADCVDLDTVESIEDLMEKAQEHAWEYADSLVPVYNHIIAEEFAELDHWQVDEYADDYCIEYDPEEGFARFQMAILFAHYERGIQEQLDTLRDALEVVEDTSEQAIEEALELVERYCTLYYSPAIMDYIHEGLTDHVLDYILSYYSDEYPTALDWYYANTDAVESSDAINAILLDYYIEYKERWENGYY